MPVTLLGYGGATKSYVTMESDAPLHEDLIQETQAAAIQRVVGLLAGIIEGRTPTLHHLRDGLLPVHAALVSRLAIMKAKS